MATEYVYLHVEVKRSTQIELQQRQITYDQTCTYDCSVGFFTFLHMSCLYGAGMPKLASLDAPRSSSYVHTVSCSVAKEIGCLALQSLKSASGSQGSVEDMKPGMEMGHPMS